MPDQQRLRLLSEDKRCIYRAVAWMLTGSLSSIGFTVCLCYGLPLLPTDARVSFYLLPFALGAVCAAVRFLATIRAAAVRDRLGCSVKKRPWAQLYAKLLRFGARETKTVKMAGFPLRSKWDQRGTPALPAAKRLGGAEKSCAEGILPADLCRMHENGGVICHSLKIPASP